MNKLSEELRRACGYTHVTPEVRTFQSAASNGLVLDAAAELERLSRIENGFFELCQKMLALKDDHHRD